MNNAVRTMIDETANAMAEGEWGVVLDNLDDNVVAHVSGQPDLRGRDALAGFLLETAAKTDDGEHLEVIDTLVGEHHAAIYFRITATRAGRAPLDNYTVHLARIKDEKIHEISFHNFDGKAVEAFWA